ncbi:hypothetical protein F418_p02 [Hafnia phage Enc34]|uniref:RecT protein n=1 Tax=Hafnia phage Enc34 TaxID=1150990 RepID=H6WYF9_9CAUD|nr:hypothetical protein F418_p02 [Hafnia phage Enc34]AFB84017.1 hypothetical protein [Hafnia phage Enc34]
MSQGILETIAANQTRIITLLEGLQLNAPASSDAGETATTKTTAKKNTKAKAEEKVKPTHTKDEVVAAVVAVKDAFGAPAAKAITGQFGLAKIAEAKEDQFDAIFDACQEKLAEADNDAGEEEEV